MSDLLLGHVHGAAVAEVAHAQGFERCLRAAVNVGRDAADGEERAGAGGAEGAKGQGEVEGFRREEVRGDFLMGLWPWG